MIVRIQSTPVKDSGIPWIGEIPANWQVMRIATLSNKITNGYVGATREIFVNEGIPYLQSLHIKENKIVFEPKYFVTYEWSQNHSKSILGEGDVLIVQTGGVGNVTVVNSEFVGANCHALIIVSTKGNIITGNYLSWLFNSVYGLHSLKSIQTGALHPHLNCGDVRDIQIVIPPTNEQRAIASFLDRKTAAIDTLIAKKQRLIQLLEEKRTALINQAVTKGLNPNVPMKDSGIAWINKIPEHWEVSRLGFLSTTIQTGPFGSQLHASEYVENGIPLVNPINIQRGNIIADYQKTVNQEVAIRLSRHKLLIGDLVFARRGELGRCGVINKNNNGWLCGTGCIQVRFSKIKVDPDYLNLFISIPWVASWLSLESVGSTMDNLNTEILSTLPIILPPKEEQIKIFQYIEFKKYLFDKLIMTIDTQINKLQEYRQSLITAAITGKIDVEEEVAA